MGDFESISANILRELGKTLEGVSAEGVRRIVGAVGKAEKVFVAGAGRSGFQMKSFAMRLAHLGLDAHVVGEATAPALTSRDLVIIGSGSGSTATLVALAAKAAEIGAAVALLTIDETSEIGRLADVVVKIPAPSPKAEKPAAVESVQPMGSLFEQALLIVLDAVVVMLMAARGVDSAGMFKRHANLE